MAEQKPVGYEETAGDLDRLADRVNNAIDGDALVGKEPPNGKSGTRWRNVAVMPANYDVVAELVKTARKARFQMVDFSWHFTDADIHRVREAVFAWGSQVVGRYKCFDARVIAAINLALNEHDTVHHLAEPKNMAKLDCRVTCAAVDGGFKLEGHATFDIVFGYARIEPNSEWALRLGPSATAVLGRAAADLGWDLTTLADKRFRPVVNALFGFPVGAGTLMSEPSEVPVTERKVHFHGPFGSAEGLPDLYEHNLAKSNGVYLWTVCVGGVERPWYVGQTRVGFGARLGQHIAGMLAGEYDTFDGEALSRGEKVVVWRKAGAGPAWRRRFLADYDRIAPHIAGMIRQLRFFVAPLQVDKAALDKLEGSLGRHLRAHDDEAVRKFFGSDIRVPAFILGDAPVRFVFSTDTPIDGLPAELVAR